MEIEMTELSYNRYLAQPRSGKGAGILVLHAWWGLNDFIRVFCDRLALEGFVALAPDMFSGKVARTVEEAKLLVSQPDLEQTIPALIHSALDELSRRSAATENGLGVIGFSFGAPWALWIAQEKPELIRAVTLFYGTNGGDGDFRQSKAAYLGHFAESDPFEPESGVNELEKKLREADHPTSFFTYPGTGHWFFEEDRQDAYRAQAARLAWDRTRTFLHSQLEGAPDQPVLEG